jgi:hypothetical protein
MVKGVFIAEWNLDIPKPTMAQLDAFEAKQQLMRTIKKLYKQENLYMVLGNLS